MSPRSSWTPAHVPDLSGKRALVTGVTAGLGEHTVLELGRRNAEVLMAGRDQGKLDASVAKVARMLPDARLRPLLLDLADLTSVRRGAAEASSHGPLDILVNNAGVMATPHRKTADGFELQLGTNHLGHFALTGLLLPQLVASGDARVVIVASQAHRWARTVPLTDPREPLGHYQRWLAYAQSKLANLLFALELHRRATAAELPLTSVAAHPGYTATELTRTGLRMEGRTPVAMMIDAATRVLAQSAAQGALPSLMAATMPGLAGGSYVGPDGPMELRGMPTLVRPSRVARDAHLAKELWQLSEQATGVSYP